MGNVLSMNEAVAQDTATTTQTAQTQGNILQTTEKAREPIYLSDVQAEPATWSQEGFCRTIQRFFGWLPDSPAEVLKQEQQLPLFSCRPTTYGLVPGHRADAVRIVQRIYRRYCRLMKWHDVANQILELARSRVETQRKAEEEALTLINFRQLLMDGFPAQKVSISGGLKSIYLKLVLNPQAEECYLTWTPSRKRKPRLNLYDVEEVVPVLKRGNKYAPRLANKVSHSRGIIIVCKTHHRGRMILEVESKRARKLLLRGFAKLLEDLNCEEPNLDKFGAIRKRMPRQQSAVDFFTPGIASSQNESQISEQDVRLSSNSKILATALPSTTTPVLHADPLSSDLSLYQPPVDPISTNTARSQTQQIEHFYKTQFDDTVLDKSEFAPTLLRPSSHAAIMEVRN